VTNLPFSLTDDGLFDLFKETNPKSAHIHFTRTGSKSRGYGFVDYDNEQQQLAAIEKMDGYSVTVGQDKEPRKIRVMVSVSVPTNNSNSNSNNNNNTNNNTNNS